MQARLGHIATVYEHSMYVFGGWDGVSCLDDLYQYSFPTNIWYEVRRTSGERPCPRYRHDALVYEKKMFIFGGVDQNKKRFNDLFSFNFESREWMQIITHGCLPTPRTFHKFINSFNLLFIVGGYDGERKGDVYTLVIDK